MNSLPESYFPYERLLVALVRAGARFANGHLIERPDESGGEAQAA